MRSAGAELSLPHVRPYSPGTNAKRTASLLERLGVDQYRGEQRRLGAPIDPSVIGAALHHHVERLELDLTLIEQQRDAPREQDHVVDRARGMHARMALRIDPAMAGADRSERVRRPPLQLARRERFVLRRQSEKAENTAPGRWLQAHLALGRVPLDGIVSGCGVVGPNLG